MFSMLCQVPYPMCLSGHQALGGDPTLVGSAYGSR